MESVPQNILPAPSSVFLRALLFLSFTISRTITKMSAGTASTTASSVKEIGISEVIKPSGYVTILNSPREQTYSVNPGKCGRRKNIAAASISGMNTQNRLKNFFIGNTFL